MRYVMPSSSNVWQGPIDEVYWVYLQGRHSSQSQVTKLTGQKPVATTTGESAMFYAPVIETIDARQAWLYPEMEEVDLTPKKQRSLFSFNDLFFYIKRWRQGILHFKHSADYTPSYPIDEQGSLLHYSVDIKKCSLGGESDKNAHRNKVLSLRARLGSKKKIILYGVSRGAATTLSAYATHHQDYGDVGLCILEGPPDSIQGIVQSYTFNLSIGDWLYHQFGRYLFGDGHDTKRESQARGHVKDYPDSMPTVIISSINDGVVPHENSVRLALRVAVKRLQALKQGQSVAPIYLLQLDNVGHNEYSTHNSIDARRYQAFIHAVYRKHELPYIEKYANASKENFELTDLTHPRLRFLIESQAMFWQEKDYQKRGFIRNKALMAVERFLKTANLNEADKYRFLSFCQAIPLFNVKLDTQLWFFQTAKALATLKSWQNALPASKSGTEEQAKLTC